MIVSPFRFRALTHALAGAVLLSLGGLLAGCADVGDGVTSVFADPAKYNLYDCKQLEAERKALVNRLAELQGLINKAQTGIGGPVVAEVAYRNDYVATRGQAKNAEEAWVLNKCRETPPAKAVAAPAPPPAADKSGHAPTRSGNAVY
jgi:hypothetical protein